MVDVNNPTFEQKIETRPKYRVKYMPVVAGRAVVQKKHIFLGTNKELPQLQLPASVLPEMSKGVLRVLPISVAVQNPDVPAENRLKYGNLVTVGVNELDSFIEVPYKHSFVGFYEGIIIGHYVNEAIVTYGGVDYIRLEVSKKVYHSDADMSTRLDRAMIELAPGATGEQKADSLLNYVLNNWWRYEPYGLYKVAQLNEVDLAFNAAASRRYVISPAGAAFGEQPAIAGELHVYGLIIKKY